MSELVREVWAFVSYWPFDFAYFWVLLAVLLLTALIAPWFHRRRSGGGS